MVKVHDRGTLDKGLRNDIKRFEKEARSAAKHAATAATKGSRSQYETSSDLGRSRRATMKPRPTRPTTEGTFASHIKWQPTNNPYMVSIGAAELQKAAPYWLIQEIGTGKSAQMGKAGLHKARGGQGRHGARQPGNITIKSQKGRRIDVGLVWTGGDGKKTDNLAHRSDHIPGPGEKSPPRGEPRITKEIKGKHYIRTGGLRGRTAYKEGLKAAFKSAFGHHSKR